MVPYGSISAEAGVNVFRSSGRLRVVMTRMTRYARQHPTLSHHLTSHACSACARTVRYAPPDRHTQGLQHARYPQYAPHLVRYLMGETFGLDP